MIRHSQTASALFEWCETRVEQAITAPSGKVPIFILQGGTSSGKTYAVLQTLFVIAAKYPRMGNEPTIISVVGQDAPNLKRGAITDATNIAATFEPVIKRYHSTDKAFEFHNGARIEFVSYETPQDAKAGKRHILFVNEANGIRHEVFEKLSDRTKVATFLDYNADAEFWVHHLYAAEAKAAGNFCRSTYLDNPFISPAVVASIEAKRGNSEWWRVYGEGRTGKSEGVIYKRAESWHEFPDDVRRFGYGLDFGFSEPLALVKCGIAGEHIYAQEIAYQSGLTPSALAAALPSWGVAKASPIWADGARPEIIMEMRRMGYNVRAAVKGPESVINGIMALNDYSMRLMGPNLTREARMYKWATHAATGQFTRVPAPSDDHALDALRYWGIMNLTSKASGPQKIISL
jgi:phage terminase large subunit